MNRIQELRKESNMTQATLAKEIGVNPVTLSRYENGDRNPKVDKLQAMADIFHVSIDYLTGKSDSRLGHGNSWDELSKKMNVGIEGNLISSSSNNNEMEKNTLLTDFEKLNDIGRKEALKQVNNLSKISEYIK